MVEEKSHTRTKIIETTAEIVGRENNMNLTIRDIAGRAGVNIASVNYYFRSKDNLMEEVEHMLLEKTRFIYEILQNREESSRVKLLNWGNKLMEFLLDYPGILYIIGTRVLVNNKENDRLADYLNMLIKNLTPVIKELTMDDEEETLSYKALQLMSGVVYPVLLHTGTGKSFFPVINNPKDRRKYLTMLINSLKTT